MFRQTALVVTLLGCVGVAVGAEYNVIYQHNPYYNNPNNPGYPFYEINQGGEYIVVYHGVPGQDFQFEAVVEDNGVYVRPGHIYGVYDWGNDTEVVITIVGDNGHPYGAHDIDRLELLWPQTHSVIKELKISGNLGSEAPVVADEVGSMSVGCSVLNDIEIDGPITGTVSVGGSLHGKLTCESLGTLVVGGDVLDDIEVAGAITGDVTIEGYLDGWLVCDSIGNLTIEGARAPELGALVDPWDPDAGSRV